MVRHIIFFVPYPIDEAPSQRFRFEQYWQYLSDQGFKITVITFYNQSAWKVLYKKGNSFLKFAQFLKAYFFQFFNIFKVIETDLVFIHREILPIGPPIMEWLISKVFKKRIIYDFDDAIWATDRENESIISNLLRWRSKVSVICGWSYKVSCGNEYLCRYALQFNKSVVLNPTTVDTVALHNPRLYAAKKKSKEIIIGWTGSHSTLKYLELILPVIQRLETEFDNIRFMVIANRKPSFSLKSMLFVPWSKEREIEDLLKIDIGVMPLPDDRWSQGKCGFKALQYMALEIPTLASPVGVNTRIIDHGKNGFLCFTAEDWFSNLSKLIVDSDLRRQLGIEGRRTVVDNYSISSNSSTFLSLFE